jgi:alpha-N-arabinofuranosidase
VEKGTTRLPEIKNVPWLEVVAAQGDSPDKMVLFCLNRSLTRDLPSRIVFDGFEAAGPVRIETLTASSLHEGNNESTPEEVVPRESTAKAGHSLDYTFPHSSVVVIHLQARE